MNGNGSGPRPWLAGLLALAATGLGHAYLRRWGRALGWLLLAFAATVALVPEPAVRAFVEGGSVDPAALAPTFAVVFASVVDAYLLARRMRTVPSPARPDDADPGGLGDPDGAGDACPNCGREIDPELDFCPWCSADLPGRTAADGDDR